jgi:hypothetical protein
MNDKKLVAATVVAIAALFGFALLVIHMLRMTSADDKTWTRTTYLLHSVEAIAFAGAGFLFGKEVHRQQAEKAESRANIAEQDARNGRALALSIKAKALTQPTTSGVSTSGGAAQRAQDSLAELVGMANRLFP